MEEMRIFSISADMFCLILCAVAVFIVQLWRKALGESGRILHMIFFSHMIQVVANLLGLLFKGGTAGYVRAVLVGTNFAEFAGAYVSGLFFTLYIISCMDRSDDLGRWKQAAHLLCYAALLALILSQFNGMYYIIDEQNYYQRQTLYPLALMFGAAALILDLLIVLRCRNRLIDSQRIAILFYIAIPVAALVCQPLIYGVYIMLIADTLAALVMVLIMLAVQTMRYYEKELELEKQRSELAESRIVLMLSQIQPHFLFNSLNSIYHLCGTDAKMAQKAVGDFSEYLRENLNALNVREPVPFEMELKHVKHYLALEKVRFGEELQIVYDIRAEGFLLPQLSVQPIVENAIKHGLGHSVEGGTVTIATGELNDCFWITVSDNGRGFDTASLDLPAEDSGHIGLRNVRMRLWNMSKGTLEVESKPQKGTRVTIRLPKEGYKDENTGG